MSELQRQAAEQAITTVAGKATYTGAVTTGAGWALSNEVIALCGLALAVLGYLTTLVFKIREDRRQQAAHDATMSEIKNRHTVVQDAVAKEIDSRLSRELEDGYSGMPKPPRKNPPKPVDEGESK